MAGKYSFERNPEPPHGPGVRVLESRRTAEARGACLAVLPTWLKTFREDENTVRRAFTPTFGGAFGGETERK
jgi:hypothetical protein